MPSLSDQSRFLSLILRHAPDRIGLTLDPGGWAEVAEIVAKSDIGLTPDRVAEIVATSPKQRFALSDDGRRIRANQGHSVPVDLGLRPMEPPEILFHGTAAATIPAILTEGLKPGLRQHVHLSPDPATAVAVGRRHGAPVVLRIAAGAAHRAGQAFFHAENGVWLTGPLAPEYIAAPE